MTKKTRTLNELRQVKDSVYRMPKVKIEEDFNLKQVIELIKKYPNDRDLGAKIREHYVHLIKKI